jgi:signal transduction histidine kinase
MTLRGKLIITFAIVLALVGIQTIVTIWFITQAVEGSTQLLGPAFGRVDGLAHLDSDVLRLRALEQSNLVNLDADGAQHAAEMNALLTDIVGRIAQYQALSVDSQRAATFDRIVSEYREYLALHEQTMQTMKNGDPLGATRLFLAAQPRFEALDADLHQLRHLEYASTEAANNQLVQAIFWARWPLGAIFVVVAAVEAGLGWYVFRGTARSLSLLEQGAKRIAREDFAQPVRSVPERELAVLGDALNHAMNELAGNRAVQQRLEEERVRLLRERLSQVVQAQERERRRVSRDLHDQAGQALTALQYGLSRLQHFVPDGEASREINRLVALATDTGHQIAVLARELRPSVLDDLGLVPALRSYIREFAERTEVPVELTLTGTLPRLSPEAETTVFRVVQESLTNVARHAHARQAWVNVAVENGSVCLRIRDDGSGFERRHLAERRRSSRKSESGLGLAGIEERVQLLGGSLDLRSQPGEGTELVVTFPLTGNIMTETDDVREGVAG